MIGTIIGGALAAGASVAGIISKRRAERRARAYDAELREYNSPVQQVSRLKQAGINTFGADYSNSAEATYDPSAYSVEGEMSNLGSVGSNVVQALLAERQANDEHELAEQQKEFNSESLFSARTLNSVLGDLYNEQLRGARADNSAKEIDNETRPDLNKANLESAKQDVVTKSTYNAKFADLLSHELSIKKFTAQRLEQQVEADKAVVLANQQRYRYMIQNPKEYYRQVEHEFEYDDKARFYTLESFRIQHLMDIMQEDMEPLTRQAMQNQLAFAISHAELGKHNDEFNDSDVLRYIDYGLDKVEQIGNTIGSFMKLGVYRNLGNKKRFGNTDYSETRTDGNGEITGGMIRSYQYSR